MLENSEIVKKKIEEYVSYKKYQDIKEEIIEMEKKNDFLPLAQGHPLFMMNIQELDHERETIIETKRIYQRIIEIKKNLHRDSRNGYYIFRRKNF